MGLWSLVTRNTLTNRLCLHEIADIGPLCIYSSHICEKSRERLHTLTLVKWQNYCLYHESYCHILQQILTWIVTTILKSLTWTSSLNILYTFLYLCNNLMAHLLWKSSNWKKCDLLILCRQYYTSPCSRVQNILLIIEEEEGTQ